MMSQSGAGPCTLIMNRKMIKGGEDSGSILHNFTVALLPNMPMSAHSVNNPSRRRIRGSTYLQFRNRFNTRDWPVSRDHGKSSSSLVILYGY